MIKLNTDFVSNIISFCQFDFYNSYTIERIRMFWFSFLFWM